MVEGDGWLRRYYAGRAHGMDVSASLAEDGRWRARIADPHAFDGSDDLEATFGTEEEALAALRSYGETGIVPEGFSRPAPEAEAPTP